MKQHEVFKKIGTIIQELNEQYEYLVNNESELNDLELELFVANAHFLADHLEILRKLTLHKAPVPEQISENKYFDQVLVIQNNLVPADKPTQKEALLYPDQNSVAHIGLKEGGIENTDPVNATTEEFPIEFKPENAAGGEPLTINQKMSAQLNNTATGHLSTQPIIDLKQAIILNDKLLYIKNLFNGYSLAYNEAIDILNRCNTFDEADRFLKGNYSVKNSWETKQETVDKFYDLLEKRYSKT